MTEVLPPTKPASVKRKPTTTPVPRPLSASASSRKESARAKIAAEEETDEDTEVIAQSRHAKKLSKIFDVLKSKGYTILDKILILSEKKTFLAYIKAYNKNGNVVFISVDPSEAGIATKTPEDRVYKTDEAVDVELEISPDLCSSCTYYIGLGVSGLAVECNGGYCMLTSDKTVIQTRPLVLQDEVPSRGKDYKVIQVTSEYIPIPIVTFSDMEKDSLSVDKYIDAATSALFKADADICSERIKSLVKIQEAARQSIIRFLTTESAIRREIQACSDGKCSSERSYDLKQLERQLATACYRSESIVASLANLATSFNDAENKLYQAYDSLSAKKV